MSGRTCGSPSPPLFASGAVQARRQRAGRSSVGASQAKAPAMLPRLLPFLCLLACAAPDAEESGGERAAEPQVRPDINAAYLSDDLDVDDLAEGFSAESREAFAVRDAVTEALGLSPGDAVADIGAGTGIYLAPFSAAVGPEGTVYAIDISELLVDYLGRYAEQEGFSNVRPVLGETADTGLEPGSLDLAFTSDVYHHFEAPGAMNAHLFETIRPGGAFAVLDFRRGPDAPDWIHRHVRTNMAGVIAEVTKAGFAFEGEVAVPGLEDNYLILFRRP